MKVLSEAGILPNAEKKGFRAQVSFYLKLQGIVEDLIALGGQSDELALHAFHRSSIHAVSNRFPTNLRTKLILKNSKLKGKEQMQGMLSTIKTWREEAQVMESAEGESAPKVDKLDSSKSNSNERKGIKAHIVAPFRMDSCLIWSFSNRADMGSYFPTMSESFLQDAQIFLVFLRKKSINLLKS